MSKIFSCLLLVICLFTGSFAVSAAVFSPAETVQLFHRDITLHNYRNAYHMMLTDEYRGAMGSYENMVRGYAATQYSQPLDIRITKQTGETAQVSYTLLAADRVDKSGLVLQTFACTAVLKLDPATGKWLLDSGTGKLVSRTRLSSHDAAITILKRYHECITRGEFQEAWNLLGPDYQKSFGSFPQFIKGFETTVSSDISEAVPVADAPWAVALKYKLTAKDKTPETNVVQVFEGMAEMEVLEDRGWKIISASNKPVERYYPPKW